MGSTGARYDLPDGSTVVVVGSSRDSGGARVELEVTIPTGGLTPPSHIHPHHSERFEVLEGTLDMTVAGERRALTQGETATISPGVPHAFRSSADGVVRFRSVHEPGMNFDGYIEDLNRLGESGKLRSPKQPASIIHLAMLWRKYKDTQTAAQPPVRAAMVVMAGIGRLLRYQV